MTICFSIPSSGRYSEGEIRMIERKIYLDPKFVEEIEENWSDFHQEHFDLNVDEKFWLPWSGDWQKYLGEMLFLQPRPGGVLVHRQEYDPSDIWRVTTSNIKLSEQLLATLLRYNKKNFGQSLPIKRYVGMITYEITHKVVTLPWVTHVFVMSHSELPLRPSKGKDSETTKVIPFDELERETDKLERLPHQWSDWGRYRAIAHRFITKHVTAEELMA